MNRDEILEMTKHFLTTILKEWSVLQVGENEWKQYPKSVGSLVSNFHKTLLVDSEPKQ